MNVLNEVLLQLREANRFADAEPQLRRLAVVLLDNIVEIQLRRRTAWILQNDRTTSHSGVRQHDRKRRLRISRFHDELLKFAVEQDQITVDESILLGYGHRVRNAYYHEGGYDELDSEISILLFYKFIRERFPIWKTAKPFRTLASSYYDLDTNRIVVKKGFESIVFGFESRLQNVDSFADEFWETGIAYLLTYEGSKPLAALMADKVHRIVDRLDHYISTLEAEEGIDWNNILARHSIITSHFIDNLIQGNRLTDLSAVLNIYLVMNRHKEDCLDIVDPVERDKKFYQLLHAHKFISAIPPNAEFSEFRARADAMAKETEAVAIKAYLEVEDTLNEITMAAETCIQDLEIYFNRD